MLPRAEGGFRCETGLRDSRRKGVQGPQNRGPKILEGKREESKQERDEDIAKGGRAEGRQDHSPCSTSKSPKNTHVSLYGSCFFLFKDEIFSPPPNGSVAVRGGFERDWNLKSPARKGGRFINHWAGKQTGSIEWRTGKERREFGERFEEVSKEAGEYVDDLRIKDSQKSIAVSRC